MQDNTIQQFIAAAREHFFAPLPQQTHQDESASRFAA